MKNAINKISNRLEDGLRHICGPMSPQARLLTILVLSVVFAFANFYFIFKAIYDIGREDQKRELIDSHIVIPEIVPPVEEEPGELDAEMESFFNEHFKSQDDDTGEE